MTLKSVYETETEVPENLKEYYTEKEGKFTFVGVENWKPQVELDNIAKALSAERKAAKALKDQYDPWANTFKDKTPAQIQADLDRIPMLEEATSKSFDKSKVDAMVESAARNRMVPIEKDRDTYKTRVAELEAVVQAHDAANRKRTILDAVREVAAKDPSFHETTYSSPRGALMLLAEQCLTIDETTGRVMVKEDVEGIAQGLGVKDALAELKNQHPYLSKTSVGGGATGSNGTGGGPNPFRENNLQKRMEFMAGKPEAEWKKLMVAAGLKSPTQLHAVKK